MAGQYRFKDSSGNIVAQISASVDGIISFSGSQVDFSQANTISLGEVQLAGTASNALLLDGFDSQAFAFTSSIHPFTSSTNSRLNSLEEKTGSLATTGSNTFFGTQVFSGSVYVKENLIVQGSSSLQNITASAVDIGTNRIILNVDNPSVRYAGISVYDSGSTAGTGSLWWDSLNNHWLYEHPSDSAAPYNSAILISGPKNTGNLGEELELVSNFVMKAVGGDHISASAIYDDGTTISLKSNTEISGTFKVGVYTSSFDGKVGIGTATPSTALTVVGNIKAGYESATGMIIGLAPSGIPASDVNSYILWADAASFGGNNGDIIYIPRTSTDGMHRFYTGNGTPTEKLRITHTGLVGIGTNNPLYRLDVLGPSGNTTSVRISATYGGGGLGMLHITSAGDEGGGITLEKSSSTAQKWKLGCGSTGAFFIYNETAASNTPFTLQTNGNISIGLGSSGAGSKLTVYEGDIRLYKNHIENNTATWNSNILFTDEVDRLGARITGERTAWDGAPMGLGFDTGAIGTVTRRMTITSDGRIGIGTTNPSTNSKIHIVGSNHYQFIVQDGTANIRLGADDSTMIGISMQNNANLADGSGDWFIGRHVPGSANIIDGMQFSRNNGTSWEHLVRITSTGNVGIGRTDPTFKLHVVEVGTTIASGNAISTSTMKGLRIDNTNNSNESVGVWFNTGGSHWSGISGQRTGTGGVEGWATDLRFYTHETSTNDLTYARERMRISADGYVTTPYVPAFKAGRSSDISVGNTSTIVFNDTGGNHFNNGGHYNNSNGVFTAPIAGRYMFSTVVIYMSMSAGQAMDDAFYIYKNNTNVAYSFRRAEYEAGYTGNGGYYVDHANVLLELASGDTVKIVNNRSATVHGNTNYTYFYGYLVG